MLDHLVWWGEALKAAVLPHFQRTSEYWMALVAVLSEGGREVIAGGARYIRSEPACAAGSSGATWGWSICPAANPPWH